MVRRRIERGIGRLKRILRQRGEDVGEEQFLMLLLVLDAESDQLERVRRKRGKRGHQRLVDRAAPVTDFVEARPADHAAPRALVALALAFVIAVEEIGPTLVVEAVAGVMVAQDEGFEEPGRVGEVPFGGRGIGMRLDGRVGIRQRRGEGERQSPRRGETRGEFLV